MQVRLINHVREPLKTVIEIISIHCWSDFGSHTLLKSHLYKIKFSKYEANCSNKNKKTLYYSKDDHHRSLPRGVSLVELLHGQYVVHETGMAKAL